MTFDSLIRKWPSLSAFADDIGVPYETGRMMRWRSSIADEHWMAVVAAASRRGIRDDAGRPISIETLAGMAAARRQKKRSLRLAKAA